MGKLAWMQRLAWAAAFGAVVRMARRVRGIPPRVWHGTFPMHVLRGMVAADRSAGYPGGSVVHHVQLNPSYALVGSGDFDLVLGEQGLRWDELHWATLCHLLAQADIFVMFFDTRFAAATAAGKSERAMRLLRRFGLRLVAVPNGLDVVHLDGRGTRFSFLARLQEDYPDWNLPAEALRVRDTAAMICRNVDFVVSGDSVSSRFLVREDARFKYFPVDARALQQSTAPASSARLRVVHAPNHRRIKGTDELLAAVARLDAAGLGVDLQLVEKVAREEALRLYAQADVIADQFCIGAYGVFALEGLAMGKPVLAYLDQEHLGDPAFDLPIVNSTPGNLDGVLAALAAVPELRERLGSAGRAAVERFQSEQAIGEVWGRIYSHLWRREPLDLETTRHFSGERQPRSFSEDPGEAAFWPVPVADLMPRIRQALEVACAR
jgi:hypothetical protein